MTFGERLKQLRTERSMSREDLAAALGKISYTTIANYENDIQTPSFTILGRMCKVFKMTAEEMFKGVELW